MKRNDFVLCQPPTGHVNWERRCISDSEMANVFSTNLHNGPAQQQLKQQQELDMRQQIPQQQPRQERYLNDQPMTSLEEIHVDSNPTKCNGQVADVATSVRGINGRNATVGTGMVTIPEGLIEHLATDCDTMAGLAGLSLLRTQSTSAIRQLRALSIRRDLMDRFTFMRCNNGR